MEFQLLRRRVDPDGGGFLRWRGRFVNEAVRVGAESEIEDGLACGMDLVGLAEMDLIGCHKSDAEMVVVVIVPVEEGPAEAFGVVDAAETLRELGLIF